MSQVMRWRRGPGGLALLIGLAALAIAGCGSSNNSSSGTSSAAAKSTSSAPASSASAPAGYAAVPQQTGGSGTPIKVAVMSECKGAFGSFDNQDMAGAVSAMSQFAGAKPVNPAKPRAGWTAGPSAGIR